jgi:hypothetical protein
MDSVRVSLTLDKCCERVKYLCEILQQARNLELNNEYSVAIENLILLLIFLGNNNDPEGVERVYNNGIDNILKLQNTAFDEWVNNVKNKFIPVPKTSSIVQQ